MIAREIVEEILARTDIASLIGSYVTLKRAGSNMTGLCPFHSEKTPSFTVFTAGNSFYCFGCGAGGDAITFLRRMENLEYTDAVEHLAKRAGVRIPQTPALHEGRRYDKNRFYEMNREAARFFHASLRADNPQARQAMDYLKNKRGLSDSTITHFGLGFAPDSFDVFTAHMRGKGYTEDELITGFLCGRSQKNGKLYDGFRNRVMFPIIDLSGNVIAFGGRVMDGSEPKYKNSSDTPVFKKSRNLFALNFARTACSEQLVLCEGYMDVIALHAAGITNAVATLGTALTEEQARLMTRYTKKVIISYDMDEAGRRAADRAVRMFGDVGMEVKLLTISDAKDPDEYIKKFGAERFRRMLEESRTKFDYNFERVLSRYDMKNPQEKIKALGSMCDLISGFYSAAERDVYIAEAARIMEVDASAIRRDVDRLIMKRQNEYREREKQKMHRDIAGFGDRVNPDFVKNPAASRAEETLLGLLLLREENRKLAFSGDDPLLEEDFYTEFGKKVLRFIRDAYDEGHAPDMLDEHFTTEEVGRITRVRIARMQLTENGEEVFREGLALLRREVALQKQTEGGLTAGGLADLINRRKNEENR